MQEAKKRDPLASKDTTFAKSWMLEVPCEEDEVFPGSGLTWGVVGDVVGDDPAAYTRTRSRCGQSSSVVPSSHDANVENVEIGVGRCR